MYQFFFITDFNIIVRRYIKKIAQKIGIVAFASFPLFTKVAPTYNCLAITNSSSKYY